MGYSTGTLTQFFTLYFYLFIFKGKLKYRETVFEGFDSMYDGFVSLFKGDNIGKVVIKI